MPLDPLKIRAIHDEVRACFKGHSKSSNKSYREVLPPVAPAFPDPESKRLAPGPHWRIVPGEQQRKLRTETADAIDDKLKRLRKGFRYFGLGVNAHSDPVLYGHKVLNQEDRIGNCLEMACAAAYLTQLRRAGAPWIGSIGRPGDHVFCIVTEMHAPVAACAEELVCDPTDGWVIDPWANVCCPLQEYEEEFVRQMGAWARQGKFVWFCRKGTMMRTRPDSFDYLAGFRTGPLHYVETNTSLPSRLPRALRERKDAPAPLPGANGVWGPDSFGD